MHRDARELAPVVRSVKLMDKSLELNLFKYVYGEPNWQIIPSEAPDFLCAKKGTPILGSEITELFTDQSDARLKKIDGYSVNLLNGGDFLHKDDKENIKIKRVKYIKKGESDGPEINAIVKKMPNFLTKASLLGGTIENKEAKVEKYLESCPAVDLIINDGSKLFRFDKYEDMIIPISKIINRKIIINSKFREIYLITTNKDNLKVKVPLRLNFFAQDITILEKLVFKWKKQTGISDPAKAITVFLYCIYKSGYDTVSLISENNELGLIIGGHLYLYTKEGKNIRDYSTMHEQLPAGKKIFEIEDDVTSSDKEIADKILKNKENYKCCLNLFMKVEKV